MAKSHTKSRKAVETLSLSQARKLAAKEKSGRCIMPPGFDLTVGRMELDADIRVVPICCEKGNTLRFPPYPAPATSCGASSPFPAPY